MTAPDDRRFTIRLTRPFSLVSGRSEARVTR
jgi:hypothetical protein